MFDSDDVAAFNAQVVCASTHAFPACFTFRGAKITGKRTAIRNTREIEAGGFVGEHDCTARLPACALARLGTGSTDRTAPRLGEELVDETTGLTLRIESVAHPGAFPEYVLGLSAV